MIANQKALINQRLVLWYFLVLILAMAQYSQAWEVDFSRRVKKMEVPDADKETVNDSDVKANTKKAESMQFIQKRPVIDATLRQSIVILNTDRGFVPDKLRVQKGQHYVIHVVNVNEKKKNVSFMLDSFKEHHATFFGKMKSFNLDPEREGVFQFQCPETAAEGRVIVFGNDKTNLGRGLAGE